MENQNKVIISLLILIAICFLGILIMDFEIYFLDLRVIEENKEILKILKKR